jgi:hypothetical protein
VSQGGFLPPEAAGREPELGQVSEPAPALPGGFSPPAGATPSSEPVQQHPGWQQPHQEWQQQAGHPPAASWSQPAATGPDNGPAVLGLVLSLSSVGLLVISAGLSTLVSLGLGIVGLMQGSKGKRLVRDGHTAKHKDLAQAGFVIGVVATVLAGLATLFWIGIGIAIAVDESTRDEFQRQLDDRQGEPAVLRAVVVVGVRLVGLVLS